MRYTIARYEDEWLVLDLPRKGFSRHATVLAVCPKETMTNKVRRALEDRFPLREDGTESTDA